MIQPRQGQLIENIGMYPVGKRFVRVKQHRDQTEKGLSHVGRLGLTQPQGAHLQGPQGWARFGAATVLVTEPASDQWASQLNMIRPGRGPELEELTGTIGGARFGPIHEEMA